VAALRADRYGLAVSNLHYLDGRVKVLGLAAQEGGAYYTPTKENLVSRNYPLTRTIFACANQPPGRPLDPKVRDFLRFILSAEGQGVLAEGGAYLPLNPDAARQELAKLP
jgi:phosphate transport system substrate-binding protein